MKQKLPLFLIAMLWLMGNSVRVMAQDIPEPTAQWKFNNPDDLMAPDKGSLTLTPALLGTKSITLTDIAGAGIEQTDGPADGNKAIFVPKASALKLCRAEGAVTSTAYTIMMDIMVPDANPFNGLLQMDEANSNDGDLFTNKNQIGIGSMGYAGNIQNGQWYRVVFTYNVNNPNGSQARLYVNGKKVVQGGANQRHIMSPFGFYLLCDEDGEKVDYTCLSEVAFWETPLTEEEACALGRAVPLTTMEIATPEDLLSYAQAINSGDEKNGVLTADIDMSGIVWDAAIGTSACPFGNIFDGQGHTITGFNGTGSGMFGLFGRTSSATIKNFSIDGKLTVTGGTGTGAIGWAANSTITGVHSTLAIAVTEGGTHHVAGVVGSAQGGNTISGCTFAGSVTVCTGNSDNFAGIVSYLGGDRVEYCTNYGTVTYADLNCSAGGITAYLNNTASYVQGCLNIGKVACEQNEGTPSFGGAIVGHLRNHEPKNLTGNCWLEGSARGAGPNDGGVDVLTAYSFTADKLATGAVCYALNGDQTEIAWYQTLGSDEAPVLDSTHGQVYMVGRLHCNGDAYTDATYSNTYTEASQDDHSPVDGFCSYCGLYFEDGLTPNADGYYEIANARQLAWFEQKVNRGVLDASAILTADIDFAQLMPEGAVPEETQISWVPIGDWGNVRGVSSAAFKGHFDGQGHTIKNLNATATQNFFGLFGVISTGALIENFTIYGTYTTAYQYLGGVAAYARDDELAIRGVHSYVHIINTNVGGRQGGIMGGAHGTLTFVENCTYSGIMESNDNGGGGNYGGIMGYANNSTATVINITNCLFDGELVNTASAPGNCTFGGIVGYANSPFATIKNCLSVGKVQSARYAQFFGALNGSNSKILNSYYQGDYINGSGSGKTADPQEATLVTDKQLESGEICWKLNEESFLDPAWHQVLDEESHPVPYGDMNGIVYQTAGAEDYETIDTDNPSSFISNVVDIETDFIEQTVAYQKLLDEYAEEVESWEDMEDLEEFFATYKSTMELKTRIKTSAANYAAYMQTCADAVRYMTENDLQGVWATFLQTYLDPESETDPSADYPNGSYAYIMENLQLDDEAILAEIDFVNQMLENAIAGGITAGTEITRLLVNPTFADGYDGWTVEYEGGTADVGGNSEIMPIPEAYNNKSFNASQTLAELPNGIYMMALSGLFRTGTDIYSQYYAGQLYLNGTYNYFMSPGEDVVYIDDNAEPGVNCLGEGGDAAYDLDGFPGWVPSSRNGCSVAFSAGRYVNFTATEVTDGTLTVGTRSLGTGLAGDWMPFGNMHIYYLGTSEQANGKLAEVLSGFAARTQIILNFMWSDDEDYARYPNFSDGLKEQLQEAADDVAKATTGEEKMELINRFSDLFNQIHACRRAYVELFDAGNSLHDLMDALGNLIDDETYSYWDNEISDSRNHYILGDVTAEEALAIADKLNNANLIGIDMADGVYQLATADDLLLFARLVNSGLNTSNAVLVRDIDFAELLQEGETEIAWPTIGDWNTGNTKSAYAGHFDGQGHTIKNFNVTATKNYFGLFGVVTAGSLIENFSISGNFYNNAYNQCGTIGFARDNSVTIRNVHCSLNITNAVNTKTIGGILGHAYGNSTVNIDRCSYSGTFTVTDNAGSDDGMYGGIFGHAYNNASTHVSITNCLFDGTLVNTVAASSPVSGCVMGGIVGWIGTNVQYSIDNCLSIGEVTNTCAGQIAGALQNNGVSYSNNYYKGTAAFGAVAKSTNTTTSVTDEQLASGEVCYKLNGDQTEIVWYQTIFEDNYPVLDGSHETVLYSDEYSYYNMTEDGPVGIVSPLVDTGEGDVIYKQSPTIVNLSGQRLNKMQKGINIVGGRKILVK